MLYGRAYFLEQKQTNNFLLSLNDIQFIVQLYIFFKISRDTSMILSGPQLTLGGITNEFFSELLIYT